MELDIPIYLGKFSMNSPVFRYMT